MKLMKLFLINIKSHVKEYIESLPEIASVNICITIRKNL